MLCKTTKFTSPCDSFDKDAEAVGTLSQRHFGRVDTFVRRSISPREQEQEEGRAAWRCTAPPQQSLRKVPLAQGAYSFSLLSLHDQLAVSLQELKQILCLYDGSHSKIFPRLCVRIIPHTLLVEQTHQKRNWGGNFKAQRWGTGRPFRQTIARAGEWGGA